MAKVILLCFLCLISQITASNTTFPDSSFGIPLNSELNSANATKNINQITAENYNDLNWFDIDRRTEENWTNLYPFGERYWDQNILPKFGQIWDFQIDLDFFLPYYGFRFNKTFVFPEGFAAFSFPYYIQPPYSFPNPGWPEKKDPSLIAAFMSPQSPIYIGEIGISNVWMRIVNRPWPLINKRPTNASNPSGILHRNSDGSPSFKSYEGEGLKAQDGRVEDPNLLDQITKDINAVIVGARGFKADYALVVTWERMAYAGAPRTFPLDMFNEVKKWHNTYQMILATDEVRSYAMFNYAHLNWTSSTSAGALSGRDGRQSAMVGFNGGNGTGWHEMPYSSEGNTYKLVQFGPSSVAGRWVTRIDEEIQYGGCVNSSSGLFLIYKGQISIDDRNCVLSPNYCSFF